MEVKITHADIETVTVFEFTEATYSAEEAARYVKDFKRAMVPVSIKPE